MNCPRPVRSRAISAAMIEKAACAPALGSPWNVAETSAGDSPAVAAQHRVACDGLHRRAVALEVAVRPAQPEAREARHHEPRVQLRQRVPAAEEAVDDARGVVLDVRVGNAHEVEEQLAAGLAAQVEGDALVAARGVVEGVAAVPEALADVAAGEARAHRALRLLPRHVADVAAGGREVLDRLDLDHLGAEVGEHERAGRPRPHDCLREDAQPREGARVVRGVGRGGHQTTFRWRRTATSCLV